MRHCLLLTAFALVIGSASAMSNAEFLSRCLNDYPGLDRTSEKGFADFVRNWVEAHDESGLPKSGTFTTEQKVYFANEAKGAAVALILSLEASIRIMEFCVDEVESELELLG